MSVDPVRNVSTQPSAPEPRRLGLGSTATGQHVSGAEVISVGGASALIRTFYSVFIAKFWMAATS